VKVTTDLRDTLRQALWSRRRKLNGEFDPIRPLVELGQLSLRKAAAMFGVGRSTIARVVSRREGKPTAPQTLSR